MVVHNSEIKVLLGNTSIDNTADKRVSGVCGSLCKHGKWCMLVFLSYSNMDCSENMGSTQIMKPKPKEKKCRLFT